MASVLVNGTPTKEFTIMRGGRQGDPLSPFLFIITLEGLHISMDAACDLHHFRGLSLPYNNVSVSHFMFADDVTFIGKWSKINFLNLNRLLGCFFLASRLEVNLNKSKFYGIGVDDLEIERLASILKSDPGSFPFTYLGLPMGTNMKLSKYWNPIIEKFRCKLSLWKLKCHSFEVF
ncbi:uncharacterized mitochondrial protein AtMg01250-like [Lactuca sativa]|uniref:uncharacterized mitochondrial protein AtMg01250-like n=1 Tax=Lactuca sativa TaxID=4236 RepID=UPI000CD8B753|nr:uncharacterized mitochondrial protein AtMg01250-like [Lactuca sativa]